MTRTHNDNFEENGNTFFKNSLDIANKDLKLYIKTYGCAFNQLDSEIIGGILEKNNYKLEDNDTKANLIIINSCTVKNTAETKLFKDIQKYGKENKKVIVCGCIPQAETSYLQTKLKNVPVLGINDLDKVVEVVENITNKEINTNNQNKPLQIITPLNKNKDEAKEKLRLLSPKKRVAKFVEIIPINEGCLSNCTYCKTKHARGNLYSYKPENIKLTIKDAINSGAKEIFLTSQDTACYGFDIGTNLPNLLKEILTIKGDYKLRIGMGNPNHFVKIIDEVLEIMQNDDRIYRFLHIPMQSGNDRILKEMRRQNKTKDYLTIIDKCRQKIPLITIANDIIVAYPTETIEEFEDTLNIMKKGGTNVLNFSRFWLRPNTPAEKYKKEEFIEGTESKTRSKIIKEEFIKLAEEQNSKWLNTENEILITEIGKTGTNTVIGRNEYYKPIIIKNPNNKIKIGDKVNVKINEITWRDFRGEIIE